jgi:flagellar basal-body rod protein FlgF
MDRLIYLSMSGAKASLQRQEVLANNLANASTRASGPRWRPSAPCRCGQTAPARAPLRWRRRSATTSARVPCSSPAAISTWRCGPHLAGRAGAGRHRGLHTRRRAAGRRRGATGQRDRPARAGRRRPHHHPCRGAGLHRPRRHRHRHRGRQRPAAAGGAAQAGAARRQPLERGTDGLFRAADGNDLPASPEGRVQGGALEGSNVSPVETMVAMIAAARQFEQQMKSLQTAEQREQAASRRAPQLAPQQRRGRAAVALQSRRSRARAAQGARRAPDRRTKPPLFRPPRPSGRGEDGPVTPGGPS